MSKNIPDSSVDVNEYLAKQSFWRRRNHQGIQVMVGLILQKLCYPSKRQRDWIDAVQAAHGGSEKDLKEPLKPFHRYHCIIAEYMQVEGETQEAQDQCVSRCIKRHLEWQCETGVTIIGIIRSTKKGEATGYIDYLTPIADQAMQLALSDPDFRKGAEGIERAKAKAVDWAIEQFPPYEPDPDELARMAKKKGEPSQLGLDEYIDFQYRRFEEGIAKVIEKIETQYAAHTEALRFPRRLASKVARLADSMARTQGARTMPDIEIGAATGSSGSGSSYYADDFDDFPPDTDETEPELFEDFDDDLGISVAKNVTENAASPLPATSGTLTPAEKPASYNAIQGGNGFLSDAPLEKPQVVEASVVAEANETPDSAVLPNENNEDLPPLSEMGRAAVEYARLGYYVVPNRHLIEKDGKLVCSCRKPKCGSPGKHPEWHKDLMLDGINSASNDPSIVRQMWTIWPEANIGLECSERSGLFAHDFDGEAGVALFEDLCEREQIPVDALIQRTGGGGIHILSKWEPIEGLSNWSKPEGAPLDIRGAKKAAQVIVWPSRHVSGNEYRWISEDMKATMPPSEPIPMSEGLRALLVGLVEQIAQKRAARSSSVAASTTGATSTKASGTLPDTYGDGERNTRLHAYCSWLRGVLGADEATILEKARVRNQEACRPPLDDDEVRKIAASCARYAVEVARVGGGR